MPGEKENIHHFWERRGFFRLSENASIRVPLTAADRPLFVFQE
jgi:hypothetical protein